MSKKDGLKLTGKLCPYCGNSVVMSDYKGRKNFCKCAGCKRVFYWR